MKMDPESIKARLLETQQAILDCLKPGSDRPLGETLEEHWYVVQMQNRLERIEQALVRLEQGQYGTCSLCHLPIQPGRLEALPEAELCLDCQSSLERKRGRLSTLPLSPLQRRKRLPALPVWEGND